MGRGRSWEEEDRALLLMLYGEGWDTSALAARFDRSEDAIRQQTAKAHVYRTADKLSEIRRNARGSLNVKSARENSEVAE
jgi:hypothetical protein